METKTFTIRIPVDIKAELEKLATEGHRSVASVILEILDKSLLKKG